MEVNRNEPLKNGNKSDINIASSVITILDEEVIDFIKNSNHHENKLENGSLNKFNRKDGNISKQHSAIYTDTLKTKKVTNNSSTGVTNKINLYENENNSIRKSKEKHVTKVTKEESRKRKGSTCYTPICEKIKKVIVADHATFKKKSLNNINSNTCTEKNKNNVTNEINKLLKIKNCVGENKKYKDLPDEFFERKNCETGNFQLVQTKVDLPEYNSIENRKKIDVSDTTHDTQRKNVTVKSYNDLNKNNKSPIYVHSSDTSDIELNFSDNDMNDTINNKSKYGIVERDDLVIMTSGEDENDVNKTQNIGNENNINKESSLITISVNEDSIHDVIKNSNHENKFENGSLSKLNVNDSNVNQRCALYTDTLKAKNATHSPTISLTNKINIDDNKNNNIRKNKEKHIKKLKNEESRKRQESTCYTQMKNEIVADLGTSKKKSLKNINSNMCTEKNMVNVNTELYKLLKMNNFAGIIKKYKQHPDKICKNYEDGFLPSVKINKNKVESSENKSIKAINRAIDLNDTCDKQINNTITENYSNMNKNKKLPLDVHSPDFCDNDMNDTNNKSEHGIIEKDELILTFGESATDVNKTTSNRYLKLNEINASSKSLVHINEDITKFSLNGAVNKLKCVGAYDIKSSEISDEKLLIESNKMFNKVTHISLQLEPLDNIVMYGEMNEDTAKGLIINNVSNNPKSVYKKSLIKLHLDESDAKMSERITRTDVNNEMRKTFHTTTDITSDDNNSTPKTTKVKELNLLHESKKKNVCHYNINENSNIINNIIDEIFITLEELEANKNKEIILSNSNILDKCANGKHNAHIENNNNSVSTDALQSIHKIISTDIINATSTRDLLKENVTNNMQCTKSSNVSETKITCDQNLLIPTKDSTKKINPSRPNVENYSGKMTYMSNYIKSKVSVTKQTLSDNSYKENTENNNCCESTKETTRDSIINFNHNNTLIVLKMLCENIAILIQEFNIFNERSRKTDNLINKEHIKIILTKQLAYAKDIYFKMSYPIIKDYVLPYHNDILLKVYLFNLTKNICLENAILPAHFSFDAIYQFSFDEVYKYLINKSLKLHANQTTNIHQNMDPNCGQQVLTRPLAKNVLFNHIRQSNTTSSTTSHI